jgi:hypothetical protein
VSLNGLKKTLFIKVSPIILLAISFCATGSGIGMFLYYSDNVAHQSANNEHMSADFDAQKSVTVYQTTSKNTGFSTIPHQISIIDSYEKQDILSYKDMFAVIWVPLLIIGSYILVHSKDGIESKVNV